MSIVLDAGAEDVRDEDERFEVVTTPEDFAAVKDRLDQEKDRRGERAGDPGAEEQRRC